MPDNYKSRSFRRISSTCLGVTIKASPENALCFLSPDKHLLLCFQFPAL
ncbi:hypothetical protein GCWU000341_02872 [Oribacterium sp. oral taxon 078 str. F0262]|nr:hypothetical protein GCWU000341_02872 [Oribacterium sp. oral taxon 078 str. F0262]